MGAADLTLRTLSASIDPTLNQFAQARLRTRHRITPETRIPTPGYEVVLGKVLVQLRQVTAAVPVTILQLGANFAR
jgi:hypothetical protein